MGVYNVKTIQFRDSLQVRLYSKPIITKNNLSSSPNAWNGKKQKKDNLSKERTKQQIEHSRDTSINRTINQIYSIARSNKWTYFVTLTIDPKKLDSTNYDLILNKLNIWTNNLRRTYAPDLKYLIVPELHKDKKKWHFHALFSNLGKIPLEFSGKVAVGKFTYDYVRKPYATKIYNLPLWKYGFSTATQIRDSAKASSYVTKYVTKDVAHILKNKHRYVASQNLESPIERVYFVKGKELKNIIIKNIDSVNYVTNTKVKDYDLEILYAEFNNQKGKSYE